MPTADLIQLPVETRSCHGCENARHGRLTFCVMFGETVIDEVATAADCDAFVPEG